MNYNPNRDNDFFPEHELPEFAEDNTSLKPKDDSPSETAQICLRELTEKIDELHNLIHSHKSYDPREGWID